MAVKLGESFFGWPPWAGIMKFITHFAEDQNKQQIYGNFQEFPLKEKKRNCMKFLLGFFISQPPLEGVKILGIKTTPILGSHRNSPRMSSLHFALGDASKYGLLDLRDPF